MSITTKNAAGESSLYVDATAKPNAPAPAKSPGFGAAILLAAMIGLAVVVRRRKTQY